MRRRFSSSGLRPRRQQEMENWEENISDARRDVRGWQLTIGLARLSRLVKPSQRRMAKLSDSFLPVA